MESWRLEVGGWRFRERLVFTTYLNSFFLSPLLLKTPKIKTLNILIYAPERKQMATIKRFEDLEIWKMARVQSNCIFAITKAGQFKNDLPLINQINRSTGSVMDNIAEGFERFSNKEFERFLVIAKGSNGEVRSQLFRAADRSYINDLTLKTRIEFSTLLGQKISALLQYLRHSKFKSKPIE